MIITIVIFSSPGGEAVGWDKNSDDHHHHHRHHHYDHCNDDHHHYFHLQVVRLLAGIKADEEIWNPHVNRFV